jgi:kynurenine formamidase
MPRYIDLSHPITNDMPCYPGDQKVSLQQNSFFRKDGHNNFLLTTGMHSGTHMDGPMHLTSSLTRIAELPLEQFAGSGFVVNVSGQNTIDLPDSALDHLPPGCIVLFYTGYDSCYTDDSYYLNYPSLSENTAHLLVKKKVKMIGLDFPSPDYAPYIIHQILLANNILIVENLTNLSALLSCRDFELLAFPFKIEADSSPVRVVARINDTTK